jgi:predicted dienelactone hydrolase
MDPRGERGEAMVQAASGRNFLLRVQDVRAVLDQLEAWNEKDGHALAGRLNLARVGRAGHSCVSTSQLAPGCRGRTRVASRKSATAGSSSRDPPLPGAGASRRSQDWNRRSEYRLLALGLWQEEIDLALAPRVCACDIVYRVSRSETGGR